MFSYKNAAVLDTSTRQPSRYFDIFTLSVLLLSSAVMLQRKRQFEN